MIWSWGVGVAQEGSIFEQKSKLLNKALIERDSLTLDALLHENLEYGHSNGWEENKQQLIRNNQSGALIYLSIESDSIIHAQKGNTALVKYNAKIKGLFAEKTFDLKLKVWQIWIREKSKWRLWARQAVKLE